MANGRIFSPVLHFDDINGSPLVGGKLYTYEAGTSTPATTYRNSQGTEANENPVVLDGRGECRVYIPEGSLFKLVLKDTLENVIWEADYVSAPAHSDNNFTDFDKEKLDGIEEGAQKNVQADWDENDSTSDAYIKNRPNLGDYAENSELAEVAFSGDYNDLDNKPAIPDPQVQSDWTQNNPSAVNFIKNKPALAPVAISGSYNDLNDVPSIPNPQEQSDWAENDASKVNFIKNKPDIPGMAQTTADAICELKANIEAVEADIPPAQVQSDWNANAGVSEILNKPDLSLKEDKSNKAVGAVDPTSTTEYPSSKAMADYAQNLVTSNSGKYISDNGEPFTSESDLPTDPAVVSHNDYAVVLTGGIYYRYKASVINNVVSWAMEYAINTNAFSPEQQAAIDSTITAAKVGNYDAHVANTTIHVTQGDKNTWNAKQNAISDLGTIRSGAQAGSTAVQPALLAEKAEVTAAALCELKENVQGVEGDIPDVTVYAKLADLAAVAFSGDYDDLIDKPDLSVFARSADLATVATTGSYTDLLNIPANLVQDASYVHTDNNFTTTLKDKLDGIAAGAEVNVQADWNQSNSAADDYIKNKPFLPVQKDGLQLNTTITSTDITNGYALKKLLDFPRMSPLSTISFNANFPSFIFVRGSTSISFNTRVSSIEVYLLDENGATKGGALKVLSPSELSERNIQVICCGIPFYGNAKSLGIKIILDSGIEAGDKVDTALYMVQFT